ncbi:hypothetical protein V1264_009390 [Littorina saxatilis]|uniref:Integrase catalytic domain-containing protein n=1 Tax=Littorina saxatilis TaxID=31220 RepID=A0AAN9ARF1_9CAEN
MVGSQNIIFCKKSGCPVVAREEIFQTISTCHTNVGHSGRDKTWAEVKSNYAGIKWDVIDIFLKTCTSCCQRQAVKSLPSGKAMINLSFLLRVQIDLIDFRSRPDNEYKWILHARDCFSKYSWAYALKSKRAAEVASHLFDQFCSFGPPRILQSDNGREFTAGVIQEVCNMWPGTVMIHGRPRHPQTQGCVERGNGDFQLKLGKWMDEHGTDWSRGLKFVVHAINTSVSSTTGTTPFELVFGQKPRADQALWEQLAAQGVVHEDDLPEDIREQLLEPSLSLSAVGEAEGGSEGSQVDVVVQSGEDGDASGSHNLEHESYSDAVLQCESQGGTGLESHGESGNQSQSSEVSQLESLAGELSMSGSQSDGFSQHGSQNDGFSQPGSQSDGFSQPGSQNDGFSRSGSQTDGFLQSESGSHSGVSLELEGQNGAVPQSGSHDSGAVYAVSVNNDSTENRKRGRQYLLLSENHIVGAGTEHTNIPSVNGMKVNPHEHAVMSVDQVFDPACVPTEGNPMQEPLEVGQFVLWRRSAVVENEASAVHRDKRLAARRNFLTAARRQESRYQKKLNDVTKSFSEGNTVGVKIHSADRTNTDVRLLTCKVLESKTVGGCEMYKVYCPAGIVKNWLRGEELVDMNSVVFPSLNAVDPARLSEVTLIHASRASTRWQNQAVARTVCSCKGSCKTKKCCCKDAGIPCGTKCHPRPDKTNCQNTDK